ncbi:tripartite motif containing 13-like [Centropristis striata]|uniref:tripartite motif containing 13-like n=1 Tax=Centropristis striata TaxID=184440 RepID=UPI0027DFF18D|nr:tripartite motif containing 13-like [Centropristis striata]
MNKRKKERKNPLTLHVLENIGYGPKNKRVRSQLKTTVLIGSVLEPVPSKMDHSSPVRIEILLKNHLDELTDKELKEFQWVLTQNKKEGVPSIPRSQLENANRMDTVDQLVMTYGLDGAVETTKKILKKMKNFDLAEKLAEAIRNGMPLKIIGPQMDVPSIIQDLSCPVCSCIFTEPVVLQCGHSFCRTCVHKQWRECPICRQVIETDAEPPINFTLKSLSEKYNDRMPLDLPEGDIIESQLNQTCSRTIREKREAFEKVKQFCDSSVEQIKSQRNNVEQKIKDDFEKLYHFLATEEESRIAVLKEEETQKIHMMQKITEISSDTFSLSDTLKDMEDLGADNSFLQNFRTEVEKAQNALPDPQLLPQVLINESKHLENLRLSVLEKMLRIIKHDDESAPKEGDEEEKQMGEGKRVKERRPFLVEEDMEQSTERPRDMKKVAKSSSLGLHIYGKVPEKKTSMKQQHPTNSPIKLKVVFFVLHLFMLIHMLL